MRCEIEKKSFLIVDDYGDMRGMLRNMLQSLGVSRIVTAANGKEAIKAVEESRFDVVLCDYNLGPGKDGQQVLEEARHRNLIGLGAVFLMITAENTREMVMGAVEYEPDSYLTKPFTKDLLRSRLEKLLKKKVDLLDVEHAVDNRELEQAIALLENKIGKKPRNLGELVKLKAEICLKAGLYDQATAIYERVLAEREMSWARLGLGKSFYLAGRHQEARQIFEDLIRENERFMAGYDWLAKCLQAMGQQGEAQEILEQAVSLSPKAIIRQKMLGEQALKNNDPKTAEKAFDKAIKLGKHSVYKHPSLFASMARTKMMAGAGAEGLKVVKEMEKEFPGEDDARLYAAMTQAQLHQALGEEEQAGQCLDDAESLYSKLGDRAAPEMALDMARAYSQLGEQDKASAVLHQAVRNNHAENDFLREVGDTLGELGLESDPSALISGIRQEIVQLNNRGVELAKEGKLDQAIGLFREAAEGMPGNKVVNLNAARVLIMDMQNKGSDPERLGNVREYLDRVKRSDPDNGTLRKMLGMYRELIKDPG